MLAPIDTATLAEQRDRALLLGFAAALRRSELVALNVEELEFDTARGLKLFAGCAAATVGAERLTEQSVALIIESRARAAQLPGELLPKLSGHSLRAGYATAAAAAAAEIEERKIANATRSQEHRRSAPLHPGRHRVRRTSGSAGSQHAQPSLSRDRAGGRGGPGTRRGGLDGTFVAVSDSLLQPAITAGYRFALLHAAAPDTSVLTDTGPPRS